MLIITLKCTFHSCILGNGESLFEKFKQLLLSPFPNVNTIILVYYYDIVIFYFVFGNKFFVIVILSLLFTEPLLLPPLQN